MVPSITDGSRRREIERLLADGIISAAEADAAFASALGGSQGAGALPPVLHQQRPPSAKVSPSDPYPTLFDVAYPERLSRWKTAFRGILILPVYFFVWFVVAPIGYSAMFAGWVTASVRGSYPPWLMAAHTGFLGFLARTTAYQTLVTDKYPSFGTGDGPVLLEYPQPEPGSLSKWRVFLWKSVLIIPHLIVLSFLSLAIGVVVFLAWFAILFTGRYPRGIFAFVVGVQRWSFRLHGYFASFHDEYPPFSLSQAAGKAQKRTVVIAGVAGGIVTAAVTTLFIVAVVVGLRPEVVNVDYARLERGIPSETVEYRASNDFLIASVRLTAVDDPADAYFTLARSGERVIAFDVSVFMRLRTSSILDGDASLTYETRGGERDSVGAVLIEVDGREAPRHIEVGDRAEVILIFVLPDDAIPVSLKFQPDFTDAGGIRYDFE